MTTTHGQPHPKGATTMPWDLHRISHQPQPFTKTQLAYISSETKNRTPTIKWQYRVTIESSSGENSSVESRHSLDLLRTLANNLEAKSKGLQLFHRHRVLGVQAQEITSDSELCDYCTSIMGLSSKATALLLSVTSDNNTLLNHQDPLKDRTLSFGGKNWSFYPDMFLGKQSGLIGIFSGVHLESIAWELTAKTMSELTTTTAKSNTNIQVKMKPIRM